MLDEDFFSLGHDVDVQLDDVARVDVDRSAKIAWCSGYWTWLEDCSRCRSAGSMQK